MVDHGMGDLGMGITQWSISNMPGYMSWSPFIGEPQYGNHGIGLQMTIWFSYHVVILWSFDKWWSWHGTRHLPYTVRIDFVATHTQSSLSARSTTFRSGQRSSPHWVGFADQRGHPLEGLECSGYVGYDWYTPCTYYIPALRVTIENSQLVAHKQNN